MIISDESFKVKDEEIRPMDESFCSIYH